MEMAGHVEKRHLKLPEVDKFLLDGCVLWKWEDVRSITLSISRELREREWFLRGDLDCFVAFSDAQCLYGVFIFQC